jgi:hypothetical protein
VMSAARFRALVKITLSLRDSSVMPRNELTSP